MYNYSFLENGGHMMGIDFNLGTWTYDVIIWFANLCQQVVITFYNNWDTILGIGIGTMAVFLVVSIVIKLFI